MHSVGILTEIYVVVKIKQKVFLGSTAMHSRKLFHLFRVSKSNPFSRKYRVKGSGNYLNLMLKTCIILIAIMQFWSLLIIIISLNFAYFYATKMSTNLAQPNLTLIAIMYQMRNSWKFGQIDDVISKISKCTLRRLTSLFIERLELVINLPLCPTSP